MTTPIELIPLPSRLMSERLVVRPYRRGDGRALYDAVVRSRAHLCRFLPWVDRYKSVDDGEVYVRKAIAWWTLREDLPVTIESRRAQSSFGEGEMLGASGLHRIDWNLRAFEIGYWLRDVAQGHGFIAETVMLLTALAFDRLSANRVEIRCDVENERSAMIPRRLGFEEEARLKRQARSIEKGGVTDTLVFALFPDVYSALPWRAQASAWVAEADEDG